MHENRGRFRMRYAEPIQDDGLEIFRQPESPMKGHSHLRFLSLSVTLAP